MWKKEGNSPSFFLERDLLLKDVKNCGKRRKRHFESMNMVDMNTAMSRYITSLGNGRAPTSSGEGRGKPNLSFGLCENGDIMYRKYPIQIFFSIIFIT